MTVSVNNQVCYYKDRGEGDIILLVHGNPDSADIWDDLITILQANYRCIAPDLPGFGRSEISSDFVFNLDSFSNWLDSFLKAIDVKDAVHLVIHDVGTFFALPWAIKHSNRIQSITVTNTLFFSDYKWHFWARIWRSPIIGEVSNWFTSKRLFKDELKKGGPLLTDAFIDKSYPHVTSKMKKTVLKLYRAMNPEVFKGWEDKYLALTKIKPILVVWGEKDPYIPLSFGYAERFANGQDLFKLPKCGHWVAAEMPQELANRMTQFLEKINLL